MMVYIKKKLYINEWIDGWDVKRFKYRLKDKENQRIYIYSRAFVYYSVEQHI